MTRVAVCGATGKTGNAVAHGLAHDARIELVACIAPSAPTDAPSLPLPDGPHRAASLSQLAVDVDVVVDFSVADGFDAIVEECLRREAHLVLGTTGIPDDAIAEAGKRFEAAGLGLIYAPNFAIGAVLMMRFAAEASRLMPDVEIVEIHRSEKRDAPSGTAQLTAQRIAEARGEAFGVESPDLRESPARGQAIAGVQVHSMRLPGAVAHQEVTFGALGQLLSIRHDAVDRSCYVPGVVAAVGAVANRPGLTTGLENVL